MAFEVLSQICQQYGDELIGSAAGTFPRVDPSTVVWAQRNRNALIRDRDERADSSSPTMSAMCCSDEDVLYSSGHQELLAGVLYHLQGQAHESQSYTA